MDIQQSPFLRTTQIYRISKRKLALSKSTVSINTFNKGIKGVYGHNPLALVQR